MARRPHVVIVGGGFGGLMAARKLASADVDVTVIDRSNHHTFQPLLYQVATAALAPSDITAPIRHILRNQENATVLLADAREIDVETRIVYVDDARQPISYDFLVLATGTRHAYFGHDEWEPLAPGLKSLEDATELRRRFLLAFENAEKSEDPAERAEWMTFVIVGGGPTGVELAGVMQEIARRALRRDFRRIDTRDTRVLLVEAGPRLLSAFPEALAARAARDLEALRVDVRPNTRVTAIDATSVRVAVAGGEETIRARTVFWAAGNTGSPLARSLGVPLTRSGQVIVNRDLSIPGHPEVFVIGDLALAIQRNGNPAPGVAQVAMQAGRVAARNIVATLGGAPRREFNYLNKGDLATIGRARAIANLFGGRIQLAGFLAWALWLFIHIMYLVGFRNRLNVLLDWAYAYLTFQRGARLIMSPDMQAPQASSRHSSS